MVFFQENSVQVLKNFRLRFVQGVVLQTFDFRSHVNEKNRWNCNFQNFIYLKCGFMRTNDTKIQENSETICKSSSILFFFSHRVSC